MQKISVEINPEVVTRFHEFGGLLVELGNLVEEVDRLLTQGDKIVSSIQQLTQDISVDLDLGGASRGTRVLASQKAATSAATMFFIMSQAPGLISLMGDMSKLKDFATLSGEERANLAQRLREEGGALQKISLKDRKSEGRRKLARSK